MTSITRDDVDRWFAGNGWQVFDFQAAVWDACQEGQSGLLHSPTGSGKTLAAWLGPLMRLGHEADSALRVLWITPLRALANERIERKPQSPLNRRYRQEAARWAAEVGGIGAL